MSVDGHSGGYPPPEEDGWRDEMGKHPCPKCGEDRLTQTLTDRRGVRCNCHVCSYQWIPRT